MYAGFIKRVLDIVLSTLGLAILWPLLLVLALCIKLDSKGPVFFRQKRFGKDKTFFQIIKFRTMHIGTPHEVPTHKLENASQYITRTGRWMRRTSLDELPQLLNILSGKMSVIGPRPALCNQEDLVALRDQYHANAVRPGLSGWAQVNGRDELSLADKAKLDGAYVKRITFGMDVKCVWMTICKVFRDENIAEGKGGKQYGASRMEEHE